MTTKTRAYEIIEAWRSKMRNSTPQREELLKDTTKKIKTSNTDAERFEILDALADSIIETYR